jgi:uncharacterized membrane protein YdjX (TVP38/TMEM64 family)
MNETFPAVCPVRLSPIMPIAATIYMLGLSSIRFRDHRNATSRPASST